MSRRYSTWIGLLVAVTVAIATFATPADARDSGERLAFAKQNQLFVADGDGNRLRELDAHYPVGVSSAAWSPDGKRVLYLSSRGLYPGEEAGFPLQRWELRVVDAARARDRRITGLDVCCQHFAPVEFVAQWFEPPVWSPDGSKIAFVAWSMVNPLVWGAPPPFVSEIFVVNSDGSRLTPRAEGLYGTEPAWSPDGRRLAYHRLSSIEVVDVETTAPPKRLNPPDVLGHSPQWSPDGRRVAFTGSRAEDVAPNGYVWVVNADGSAARNLPAPTNDAPSWSPDSRWIGFSEATWGNAGSGISVIRADGKRARRLTPETSPRVSVYRPQWSPDGSRIAFTRADSDGSWDLWTVDTDRRARAREVARFGDYSLTYSWRRYSSSQTRS